MDKRGIQKVEVRKRHPRKDYFEAKFREEFIQMNYSELEARIITQTMKEKGMTEPGQFIDFYA